MECFSLGDQSTAQTDGDGACIFQGDSCLFSFFEESSMFGGTQKNLQLVRLDHTHWSLQLLLLMHFGVAWTSHIGIFKPPICCLYGFKS